MSCFVLGFRSYFMIIINGTFHCFFIHNDFEYIYFSDKHALHSVVCVKCFITCVLFNSFFLLFSWNVLF